MFNIMEDIYNNTLEFASSGAIAFSLAQEFPSINPNKSHCIRVYITENNLVKAAKIYRDYDVVGVVCRGEE